MEQKMNLTIKEIAALFEQVEIRDESLISSVEFDSRKITSGGLFVPLAGERDGHDFVAAAKENGAVATFWSRDLKDAPSDMVVILVADVLAALQTLAQYYLQKVNPKVAAITGSNGKTTTKDMTAAVMATQFNTYKTQGNYNNNIGMPYTILHMPADCEVLVLEMGMDHAGELTELSLLAQPDAAAITIIGEAHIENLGSRAGIAKAKMEITAGLKRDGLLVIPADEPLLTPLIADLPQEITTFGLDRGDLTATITKEDKAKTTFMIQKTKYTIPVIGGYNVKNALIAYALGKYFGVSLANIKQGLAKFQLTKNRTEWLTAKNGAQILSDVYNANPTAMGLVLDTVANLKTDGRKLAVLADMLELGPDSKKMHAKMAHHIDDRFSVIFLYGSEMKSLFNALTQMDSHLMVYHFDKENKAELLKMVQAELRPTDTIVLKGSNGMGLTEVVAALI
ncbi:UDP-N-acetylmuramoyl-tripeptide-D-alanyl-D- alanine ligase [Enterococcus canintestini]|uniref:UDP-N-acetylmuramoyl-tripeptide--D-alanyl-D-alanine ligase n=2 Tax=Enterococcus canintestini TaxID=317010 RepID=A0A1L8R4I2_9ENTE|nr:UDP-N-acetylmuramoyl-tripeptide-D-alanyl-D- alanine ligase [Enterococcus canintestini]